MATFISPSRRCLKENAPLYFPFSVRNSRNVLEDYKSSQNKEIKILFLGCQDLMDALTTIASKTNYDGHLALHLNFSCPLTFARNVLVVKVISANDFNVNKVDDLSYLWDLWYNAVWPKSTLDRFVIDIKELVERGPPPNCSIIKSDQLGELQDVWTGWLTSLDKHLIEPSQIAKVLKERLKFISNGGRFGNKLFSSELVEEAHTVENLSRVTTSKMEIEDFPELLEEKLRNEVDTYFETGNCRSSKIPSIAAINPTLLEPKTLRWLVNIYSSPFDAYYFFMLPLPWSEFEVTSSDPTESELTQYCQKMLKKQVASYRNLVESTNFHFCWSDKLEYFHMESAEKFDVIDCCPPAEELGLPNILLCCIPRLNSPESLLITESNQWNILAITIAEYVEKTLCAPISMIPTLYGFRFKNPVDLGRLNFCKNDDFETFSPIKFTWSPAPQFKNVPFCVSPSIEISLKKLQKKCYFMEHSKSGQQKDDCFKRIHP